MPPEEHAPKNLYYLYYLLRLLKDGHPRTSNFIETPASVGGVRGGGGGGGALGGVRGEYGYSVFSGTIQ